MALKIEFQLSKFGLNSCWLEGEPKLLAAILKDKKKSGGRFFVVVVAV